MRKINKLLNKIKNKVKTKKGFFNDNLGENLYYFIFQYEGPFFKIIKFV